MVLPPILELLIRRFGWRGSLQIQAVGAAVLLGLCAATYRHPRPEALLDKEGREMAPKGDAEGPSKASPFPPAWERSLCNSPVFVTFCLSVMLCAVGYFVPFVHLVRSAGAAGPRRPITPVTPTPRRPLQVTYMEDAGSTRAEGAFAVALIGLASTVGACASAVHATPSTRPTPRVHRAPLPPGPGRCRPGCVWMDDGPHGDHGADHVPVLHLCHRGVHGPGAPRRRL